MGTGLFGGCFCGAIRYKITGDPVMQVVCFCRDCLATTGTDGYSGYMIKSDDLHLIDGTPRRHERFSKEGRPVIWHFCGECGSNLYGITAFGLTSVAAGSLDDPEIFRPEKKVFCDHAPGWARIPDDLEEM